MPQIFTTEETAGILIGQIRTLAFILKSVENGEDVAKNIQKAQVMMESINEGVMEL